ncbi:arginine--tRNA ligase [Bartonella sp. TP]|uniref:arginine--tRNA ligase n=1 Tax=Bartonella sp. TP TaxID=3057550 RepID=UPI0025B0D779|nr:arginine--tRNA ligase [Bartonella sp. TP]WJW79996.1 arginine--tRNA ligase [Bartonella sp. TP]
MNIFQYFEDKIKAIAKQLAPEHAAIIARINVEAPKEAEHGDLATNAAMVLAKPLGQDPRTLAQEIAELLQQQDAAIEKISIAGPGFINLGLSADFWHKQLAHILNRNEDYGKENIGEKQPVNLEFVSANPTGPMHVGHCRGAVVGDVLANLLGHIGYKVTKEYYINDAGGQIDVLAESLLLRYREELGEHIGEIPAGLYPGEYLRDVAQKLVQLHGSYLLRNANKMQIIRDFAVAEMMQTIRSDLAALNIHHDIFFSERQLHTDQAKLIQDTINDLTLKGYVYKGHLEAPKGGEAQEWESREQLLFRSTAFGDDQDRALVKADGSYAYFAADIAYFRDKFLRGFKEMIYILGADHSGYVKRLEAVANAVAGTEAKLEVLLCQLVKLYRNGTPVRMSKRSGEFVTLRDVVDEVGPDPVRFMMLYRKTDAPLDFDFSKVTEQSKDNPVFYVQYAVARCHSIYRQAKEQLGLDAYEISNSELLASRSLLSQSSEMQLLKKLCSFPQLIKLAAVNKEPHRLAFYLYDLASLFHAQWNKGNDNPAMRFIQKDKLELTMARLGLVRASCIILSSGLNIMGVNAPQTMK